MSDKTDSGKEKQDDTESEPLGGERLAEARHKEEIPLSDIAKELHLDEFKVEALERNEFDVLGAPVFAKGYLRKYAQLVGVAEDDVMADYYQLNRAETTRLVVTTRKPRRELSPGPWIVVAIVAFVLAVLYWWFVEREPAREVTTPVQPETGAVTDASEPQPEPPAAATDSDDPVTDVVDSTPDESSVEGSDEGPDEGPDEPAADESIAEVAAEEVTAAPVSRPDPAVLAVTLSYSGDCWTEITDAGGRRLFFNLGSAGDSVDLSGRPPLNVLFGNADNVTVTVNNQPYAIPASSRRGRTARLTIPGP